MAVTILPVCCDIQSFLNKEVRPYNLKQQKESSKVCDMLVI